MVRVRRCRHEIFCAILERAKKGELLTWLMLSSRTDYMSLKKYLKKLNDSGLIEQRSQKWFTTEEGRRFIEMFNELEKLGEDTRHE